MKPSDLRTILVPIDFSKLTKPAIETANALAGKFDAVVHLVHVHQFQDPFYYITPMAPLLVPLVAYEKDAIPRIQRALKSLARRHGISPENCHLLTGGPAFDEICRCARERSADLIIMPTHARAGLDRLLAGSTAERVVQHSPCPVLVARAQPRKASRAARGKIDSILVPVDFSQSSFQALEYAIAFAERVAAKLIVFHAIDFSWAFMGEGRGAYDLEPMREAAQGQATRQMEKFIQLAKFRGVRFETAVRIAPPVSEICDFAEQRDVDLIITATHGRTGFAHLLLGSVAEQVVRHARRPVLVVPSHPEFRKASLPHQPTPASRVDAARARPRRSRIARPRLTEPNLKLMAHPLPERRQTNKFRESHAVS